MFNFSQIMLDKGKEELIYELVREQPRTVQEVAQALEVSWLTAERYIKKLSEEEGMIATKTFRGGTKGALKIVFWNLLETSTTSIQHRLEEQLLTGRFKQDWSATELYYQVEQKKKKARMISRKDYEKIHTGDHYRKLLLEAEEQILFFSGNLSYINLTTKEGTIYDTIVELAHKGVKMKFLTRINILESKLIEKLEAINTKVGKNMVEVRHAFQPARVTIIDDKIISIKEIYDHNMFGEQELLEEVVVFYEIYDSSWTKWIARVFWKQFQTAISSKHFLEELKTINDAERYFNLNN